MATLKLRLAGLGVERQRTLEADDAYGILQLARYAAHAPVSLQRFHYNARKQRISVGPLGLVGELANDRPHARRSRSCAASP